MMERDGFVTFGSDPRVLRWANAAYQRTNKLTAVDGVLDAQLRHQQTWFVGVDTLDNTSDGTVGDVQFLGPWDVPKLPLHRAQISIVYAGYPQKDVDESEANHRYRVKRRAAHVDGLLPVGPEKRRFVHEPHAYILGLPLNDVSAAPTVVWKGSHHIMKRALVNAIGDKIPADVDITEVYQAARREVFERCEMVPITCKVGESFLLDRFALHGTECWDSTHKPVKEGRMIAFLRPEFSNSRDWLG
jgi:hypothetical protein